MDRLQNQSHRSICRFPARFQGPCPSRNAERRAKGENSIEKRVFLGCSLAQSVILTRARTCPRRLDESTLRPSRTMGCDDASKAALLALSGMTTETGTFPAARFRPAPRFDASACPRQSPPGGGLGGRRLSPRDASIDVRSAIEPSIAQSRGAPGRRVGGRAARHARDPNLATAASAGFSRPFVSQRVANRGGFGARCTFCIFRSPPTPLRRFPFLAPRSRQHLRRRRGIPHREIRLIVR